MGALTDFLGGAWDWANKNRKTLLNVTTTGIGIQQGLSMRKDMKNAQRAQQDALNRLSKELSKPAPMAVREGAMPAQRTDRKTVKKRKRSGGSSSSQGLLTSNDGNTTKLGGY